MHLNRQFSEKLQESMASVLPITAIVFLLSVTIAPLEPGTLVLFLFGAVLLVIGMGFFTLGVDMSMLPMGEGVGAVLSGKKRLLIPVLLYFLLGVLSTMAEPDLTVLANQIAAIPNMVLILTVAVGVGLFLVVATLRVRWGVPLRRLLLLFYGVVFLLAAFAPANFIPVSFDSGGVTTGPITVPFIMALGLGVASSRSDKNAASDSFGLVALCSIGPILSVLLLGIVYQPDKAEQQLAAIPEVADTAVPAGPLIQGPAAVLVDLKHTGRAGLAVQIPGARQGGKVAVPDVFARQVAADLGEGAKRVHMEGPALVQPAVVGPAVELVVEIIAAVLLRELDKAACLYAPVLIQIKADLISAVGHRHDQLAVVVRVDPGAPVHGIVRRQLGVLDHPLKGIRGVDLIAAVVLAAVVDGIAAAAAGGQAQAQHQRQQQGIIAFSILHRFSLLF